MQQGLNTAVGPFGLWLTCIIDWPLDGVLMHHWGEIKYHIVPPNPDPIIRCPTADQCCQLRFAHSYYPLLCMTSSSCVFTEVMSTRWWFEMIWEKNHFPCKRHILQKPIESTAVCPPGLFVALQLCHSTTPSQRKTARSMWWKKNTLSWRWWRMWMEWKGHICVDGSEPTRHVEPLLLLLLLAS